MWARIFFLTLFIVYAPIPGTLVYISKKIHNRTDAIFNIYEKNKITQWKYFSTSSRTCEKIEIKRGHFEKRILLYKYIKTRICAFMTYSRFLPKSSLNLRFAIQDSRVRNPPPCPMKASSPWILNDKSKIWATSS